MQLAFVIVSYFCLATSTVQPVIQDADNLTITEGEIFTVSESQYDLSQEFLNCGKLAVESQHYKLLTNSSVYVPIYRELYDSRNYVINNGTLYVCPPSIVKGYSEQNVAFVESETNPTLGSILTGIFLILSCICLGLHLCIFVIVPEYKTLTGKNTASIAACLFTAYALFLVGGNLKSTDSCTRMAAAICYFFLSSFFWMNSFAFDVWLSLNSSVKKLHNFVIKTKESVRYMIYACYSFGFPIIIVGAAVIVDSGIFGNNDYFPVFSKNSCWFQSYKSFIIFFIIPYITLTLLDALFFVLSILAIVKLKTSGGKHELSPKRRFILCMRLAAATGLPWLIGIIAMLVKWEPLWYVFIAFTTLQGVYIFVAYNCNKKTMKYLLGRFKNKQKSPSTSIIKSASSHL